MAEDNLKKQQMEYILISVLVVVAFFIGISRFQKKETDDEVFSRTEFNKKWKEVEKLEASIPVGETAINYEGDMERIPFKSPFEEEEKAEKENKDVKLPDMTFQGMVWNSYKPQVIIDNIVYGVGETIEIGSDINKLEVRLIGVEKDGISLMYEGEIFKVKPKIKLKKRKK